MSPQPLPARENSDYVYFHEENEPSVMRVGVRDFDRPELANRKAKTRPQRPAASGLVRSSTKFLEHQLGSQLEFSRIKR